VSSLWGVEHPRGASDGVFYLSSSQLAENGLLVIGFTLFTVYSSEKVTVGGSPSIPFMVEWILISPLLSLCSL